MDPVTLVVVVGFAASGLAAVFGAARRRNSAAAAAKAASELEAALRVQDERIAEASEPEMRYVDHWTMTKINDQVAHVLGELRAGQVELRGQLVVLQADLERIRRKSGRDQLVYFLLGALLTIPTGLLVNYFSSR